MSFVKEKTMKNLLVDSNYLCYRSKFRMPDLSHDEKLTSIIFGFLSQVFELANRFNTNRFVFAWDSGKSLRRSLYPEYKAKRHADKTDEEREKDRIAYAQFDELRKEVLPALGFKNVFYQDGYESDDLIAWLVMENEEDFTVISSDNDLWQVLDYCDMYDPRTKEMTTRQTFMEQWQIEPVVWLAVKAVAGCPTDNIAGVPGVGEKTAIKFLKEQLKYESKVRRRIVSAECQQIIERNRKLVKLPMDGVEPMTLRKDEFTRKAFMDMCHRYDFRSFLLGSRLGQWLDQFCEGE